MNLQLRTVRGQTRPAFYSDRRTQITADMRRAQQKNFRFVFGHRLIDHLGISVCGICFQLRRIRRIDDIRAVAAQLINDLIDIFTADDNAQPAADFVRQPPAFSQEFDYYRHQRIVSLLCKDPDIVIFLDIHAVFRTAVHFFESAEFAYFQAGAALRTGRSDFWKFL